MTSRPGLAKGKLEAKSYFKVIMPAEVKIVLY